MAFRSIGSVELFPRHLDIIVNSSQQIKTAIILGTWAVLLWVLLLIWWGEHVNICVLIRLFFGWGQLWFVGNAADVAETVGL